MASWPLTRHEAVPCESEGHILLETITETITDVLELKSRYISTWRDQPESYWFARLVEEVGELGGALVGSHNDSPDWELKQIAAICLNWLEYRADGTEVEEGK